MYRYWRKRWKIVGLWYCKRPTLFFCCRLIWVQLFHRRWHSENVPFLPFPSLFLTLSSLCMPLKCSPIHAKMWSVGQGWTSKWYDSKKCLAPSLSILKWGYRQSFNLPNPAGLKKSSRSLLDKFFLLNYRQHFFVHVCEILAHFATFSRKFRKNGPGHFRFSPTNKLGTTNLCSNVSRPWWSSNSLCSHGSQCPVFWHSAPAACPLVNSPPEHSPPNNLLPLAWNKGLLKTFG